MNTQPGTATDSINNYDATSVDSERLQHKETALQWISDHALAKLQSAWQSSTDKNH